MTELEKLAKLRLRMPKGLKKFIFEKTDFRSRNTIVPRFVETIEIWHGRLLLRTFAFVSETRLRDYEDMQIREVHRELEGYNKCLLRDVWCNMYGHRVEFDKVWQEKEFYIHNGAKWNFWSYRMYDKEQIIQMLNIPYCQYANPLNKSNLSFFDYICKYRAEPKIELLVKAGLSQYICGLRYLDLKQKSIEKIFKVDKKWVEQLKDMNISLLLLARKYKFVDKKIDLKYIQKLKDYKYIKKYLSFKLLEYVKNLKEITSLSEYDDYLRFAESLGMDMTKNKVLFPIDLKVKHDELMNKLEEVKSEIFNKSIMKQSEKYKKLIYENEKFCIFPTSSADELIEESKALDHCVRTYAERIANGETEIMFVREKDKKDKPLYTLELKQKRIIQFRAKNNSLPKEEAIDFVKEWSKKNKLQCNL